jgi:flagellar assembly protein FliH
MGGVIKHYSVVDEGHRVPIAHHEDDRQSPGHDPPLQDIDLVVQHAEAERIIAQAKMVAEEQLRVIVGEKQAMLQVATNQIREWWEQKRKEDEDVRTEVGERARKDAYEQAYADAFHETMAQQQSLIASAQAILREAHTVRMHALQEAREAIAALAMAIASKIIRRKCAEDRLWMHPIIEEVLATVQEPITLRVHPDAFAAVRAQRSTLPPTVLIEPDAALALDGCTIHTAQGMIDASIGPQLQAVREVLACLAQEDDAHAPDH